MEIGRVVLSDDPDDLTGDDDCYGWGQTKLKG